MSFNKGIDYNLSGTLTLGNSNFKYLTNTSYAHLSGALSASVISGSQITGSQLSEISNIRTLGEHYTFNAFGVTGSSQPALYFFNSVFSTNWFNDLTFKELLIESRLKEELVFIP